MGVEVEMEVADTGDDDADRLVTREDDQQTEPHLHHKHKDRVRLTITKPRQKLHLLLRQIRRVGLCISLSRRLSPSATTAFQAQHTSS